MKYPKEFLPENYVCSSCAAHGCKLWREYGIVGIVSYCCDCAAEKHNVDISTIHEDGKYLSNILPGGSKWSYEISWCVPYIPDLEGIGAWGYTSVPDEGIAWWEALPLRVKE